MKNSNLFVQLGRKSLALAGLLGLLQTSPAQSTGQSTISMRGYDSSGNYSREVSDEGLKAVVVLERKNAKSPLYGPDWKTSLRGNLVVEAIAPQPHYPSIDGIDDLFCTDSEGDCYAMSINYNRVAVSPEKSFRNVAWVDSLDGLVGPTGNVKGIIAEYVLKSSPIALTSNQPDHTMHTFKLKSADVSGDSMPPTVQDINWKIDDVTSEPFTVVSSRNKNYFLGRPIVIADPSREGMRVYSTGGKANDSSYVIQRSANLIDWEDLYVGSNGVSLVGTNHVTGAQEILVPRKGNVEFYRAVEKQ